MTSVDVTADPHCLHFTQRSTVMGPTAVVLRVALAIAVLASKRSASRADTLSNRTFADVKWV